MIDDITKVLQENSMFKNVFDQSYDSIVITDAQLELPGPRFIYVNKAFTDTTGYTLKDLKDKTPRILQGKKTDRDVIKHLKESLKRGKYFSGSTVNYTKEGEEYYVEWNISPIKDETGKIIYFTSVQKNITKKVLLENKLKEEQHKKNIALRQVAMQDILKRISHHWRQPLSTICTAASSIQMNYELFGSLDSDIDSTMNTLDDIVQVSQLLSKTIDTLSELCDNNCKSMEDKFNLSEVIDDIFKLYALDMEEGSITLDLEIENNLILIVNKYQLLQILLPIIDNSIYFLNKNRTKNRKIGVKAFLKGEKIVIKISDNAGGIDSENMNHIFEPYFSTKAERNETGLGLYLAKTTMDNYFQGTLDIKNSVYGIETTIEISKY